MVEESGKGTDICCHRRSVEEVAVDNREITRTDMSVWGIAERSPSEKMQTDRGWEGAKSRKMHEGQ